MSELIFTPNVTTPAAPSTGKVSVYTDKYGYLKTQNDAGVETPTRVSLADLAENVGDSVKRSTVATVPIITANTRYVQTFNMGTLKNKTKALIGFNQSASLAGRFMDPGLSTLLFSSTGYFQPGISSDVTNLVLAYDDYTKARRFMHIISAPNAEKYGAGSNVRNDSYNGTLGYYGDTYSTMNIGRLVGWYEYSGLIYGAVHPSGYFSKKIELESVWLTQSGTDTIVNAALYNRDSTSTSTVSIRCYVFE